MLFNILPHTDNYPHNKDYVVQNVTVLKVEALPYHLPSVYLPATSGQDSATSLPLKPAGPAQLCLMLFGSSIKLHLHL